MSTRKHFCLYVSCCLLLVATTLTSQAQQGKKNFTIEGTVKDMPAPPEMVYLSYDTLVHRPDDSARVRDGKYRFEGRVDEPTRVKIRRYFFDADGQRIPPTTTADAVDLFAEPGVLQVVSTGTMQQAVVTGSPATTDFLTANEKIRLWGDSLRALYKMGQETKNQFILQSIVSPQNLNKMGTLLKQEYTAFIRLHPASGAALLLVRDLMDDADVAGSIDSVAVLYQLLPAGTRTGPQGAIVGTRLGDALRTALGHPAPDFTARDADGHPVSLSSFKGKYVFLDFWVSSEPNAESSLSIQAKLYETYGSKGLVVLGVSMDEDRESWLQMIHEANLGSTVQVSDLKGRDNAVTGLYGIGSLPMNLLIDPHGVIVARHLNSLNIDKTLSAIFE